MKQRGTYQTAGATAFSAILVSAPVAPLREPLHHPGEVVAAVLPLFLPGEDPRGVHQGQSYTDKGDYNAKF